MNYITNIIQSYTTIQKILVIYIILINISAFVFMGIDKRRAINHKWRIKEATLMLLAFLGGSMGIIMGMLGFKHKLSKKKFYIGVPLLYILNRVIETLALK